MELRLKARPCIQKCLMKDVTDHRMKIVSHDRPSYSTQFHCSKKNVCTGNMLKTAN
jgi:hypothetical protein